MITKNYSHTDIEQTWKARWKDIGLDTLKLSQSKKPYYNLMMFPYPSAEGLHVGNMYAFTGSDIYGRFKRMEGYNVFQPIGLDGFGIHSENFALKIGRHPMEHAKITETNYYNQLRGIGAMFDWTRTVETYHSDYYKWTQWLFVEMFKHGLAYRDSARVNWCLHCKTVLADEQVIEGKCERCGNIVEKRSLEQWFFRITAYAEKLLENLAGLDWAEKVTVAQRAWIGKKEGINIRYSVIDGNGTPQGEVTCFTTRPDTNFGATFVVIAPEHPFVSQLLSVIKPENVDAITQYVAQAVKKSEIDRSSEGKKKTGVFTNLYCINNLNGKKLPLYISDFVLMGFGTGAVVGVPAHDKRDFEFAQTFSLPIERVVRDPDGNTEPITTIEQVQEEAGIMIHSDFLNGLPIQEAIGKMMDHLEENKWGERVVSYHLRDWLISRQRYWGPPIPMIKCETCAKSGKSWFTTAAAKSYQKANKHNKESQNESDIALMAGWYPVPDNDLPVVLPNIEDYRPGDDGVAPLAKHKEFYETVCPGCGGKAVRETDVSDTFLDSSWYFLRYPSVGAQTAAEKPFDPVITKTWLPVNMYTGGAEHSVLHLMYSRFVTMALHDWGYINFDEPFSRFFAHGLVIKDGAKMSKSKGNVVNPDEYIKLYGADALRMYLMFMGPFNQGGDFRDAAMEGMSRWVGRVWRMVHEQASTTEVTPTVITRALMKLIQKVGEDLERRHYNTALASMMEFTNLVAETKSPVHPDQLKLLLLILAPFAPFVTEELWQFLHGRETLTRVQDSIHSQTWPSVDVSLIQDEEKDILVQVNGKLRDKITVLAGVATDEDKVRVLAESRENVQRFLTGQKIVKVIFVPNRLINFVL